MADKFTVYLGESISGELYPELLKENQKFLGVKVTGLPGFIDLLELHLGLKQKWSPQPLQIESYIQALQAVHADSFFAASFQVDPYGVAQDLFHKRQELMEAGLRFDKSLDLPPRLNHLKNVESFFEMKHTLPDRTHRILSFLEVKRPLSISEIILLKPVTEFAPLYQELLKVLAEMGIQVTEKVLPENKPSLKAFKVKNEFEAAIVLKQLSRSKPETVTFLSGDAQLLDLYLQIDGRPCLGQECSSSARPVLQLILLISEFLWEPLDPCRVIEFLNLPVKPLSGKLASKLARALSKAPGFGGAPWLEAIEAYKNAEADPEQLTKNLERLSMLFDRPRYAEVAPLKDIAELFSFLAKYLRGREFLAEAEVVTSITKLINLMSKRQSQLSKLELQKVLEHNIPKISFVDRVKEVGHMPAISRTENLTGSVDELIWYPFTNTHPAPSLIFWNKSEQDYLSSKGISLLTGYEQQKKLLLAEKRLLGCVKKEVYLIIPETINGEATPEHPLKSEFELEYLSCADLLAPLMEKVPFKPLPSIRAHWTIRNPELLKQRGNESYSSLEKLFYYPWLYLLKYQANLSGHSELSVEDDGKLRGNFTHKVFEEYFNLHKTPKEMKGNSAAQWFDANFDKLIEQYAILWKQKGKETTLAKIRGETRRGLITLTEHLVENDWTIDAMEMKMETTFFGAPFIGYIDMTLKRGDERCVLDLKFAGKKFSEMLSNNTDLQLALYSKYYGVNQHAYTAYYLIATAELHAKESKAFKQPHNKTHTDHHSLYTELLEKMERTHEVRREELSKGEVVVRDKLTIHLIAEKNIDSNDYLDLTGIEGDDYHDYNVLLGLKRKDS